MAADSSELERARVCLRLDEHFAAARRHATALVLARRVGDETVERIASARLRRALVSAVEVVHATAVQDAGLHGVLVASFNEAAPAMCELLQRVPPNSADSRPRHSPWGSATARLFEVRGGRSHVFELDASGRDLQEAAVCGLHISHSRFITDMRRAQFADSLVEASDFSYADLRGTLWQRARIRRCYFRDARFSDAAFDDTMFVDCDMRGVDFSMDSVDLSTTPGVTFVRCDLRGACWGGRDYSGFEMFECQVLDTADLAGPIARTDEPRRTWTSHAGCAPLLAQDDHVDEVAGRIAGGVAARRPV